MFTEPKQILKNPMREMRMRGSVRALPSQPHGCVGSSTQ